MNGPVPGPPFEQSSTDEPAETSLTMAAGPQTRRRAARLAAALIVAAALILPMARVPGPEIPAFLPIFGTSVIGGDLLTAFLLYHQSRAVGNYPLVVLAAGYLFTGLVAGLQLLVFPGVFAPAGLLGAGPQTAVWLWMFWHGGFASFVILYAGLARSERTVEFGKAPRAARAIMACTAGLVGLLGLLTIRGHDLLPPLVSAGDYGRSFSVGVAPLVLGLNALAAMLVLWFTRLRTIVQTWLFVAVLACFLDALVTLFAGVRFSMGWYVARVNSVFSALAIFAALQAEMIRLYKEVVRLNRRLSALAVQDGLTGIANRRHFDQALNFEWRRAVRSGSPLALLMMDVEFFKKFNDRLGHPAGDACLKAVAKIIAGAAGRPGDLVARYGGEEFVALAADTDRRGAEVLAARVIERLREAAIPHPEGVEGRVSLSVGIGLARPVAGVDPATLLADADAALYRAKQSGRDRVEIAA